MHPGPDPAEVLPSIPTYGEPALRQNGFPEKLERCRSIQICSLGAGQLLPGPGEWHSIQMMHNMQEIFDQSMERIFDGMPQKTKAANSLFRRFLTSGQGLFAAV